MRKIELLLMIVLLASSIKLSAQEQEVNLKEVEISAKSIDIYSNLGRIVTIIDKVEIQQKGVKSLDELLEYAAGVDVRQRGVNGVQSDVSVRGGSFDQLLVLLNGINITDPQTGHFAMDVPVDIADILRVEILQGAAARVLGANAFSGAINIVTVINDENQIKSSSVAGSYGYVSQHLSGNYSSNNFGLLGSVSYKQSDGYRENTDYNNTNAYFMGEWKDREIGKINLQLAFQQKSFGANSFYTLTFPNQYEHTKTFFSGLQWNYTRNRWKAHAQAYYRGHADRFELFRNNENAAHWYDGHNYHFTDVIGGKATLSYQETFGKTTLGVDVKNEHILSNKLGENMTETKAVPFEDDVYFTKSYNRFFSSFFIDQQVEIQNWYLSAGVSMVNYTDAGNFFNYGADISYKINSNARVYLSANSAFRLPTFTDLFYTSKIQQGNPDLKPEESLTLEAGTKINSAGFTVSASLYYRLGKNNIDWVKRPEEKVWTSRNLTEINALGADLQCSYQFDNAFLRRVNLIYSFVNLDKMADGFDSKYALDYLKHKAVVELSHNLFRNTYVNWSYQFNDRSGTFTDVANKLVNYKPFGIVNTKINWEHDNVVLFGEVNNILNTDYVDFGGLPLPGTNFNVGIKLTLNQ